MAWCLADMSRVESGLVKWGVIEKGSVRLGSQVVSRHVGGVGGSCC